VTADHSTASGSTRTPDSRLVLGIDGGATKTTAWLAVVEQADEVLGRGTAGPANPRVVGFPEAQQHITRAIEAAFTDARRSPGPVAAAALALAGVGRAEERAQIRVWAEHARMAAHVIVTDDAESILAAGAPEGWGVALICGTGTLAWGRNTAGQSARVGGWGYLLGDEGSAYAIALNGLRASVRAADGRGPRTTLLFRFQQALDAATPDDLVGRIYDATVTHERIAALATVVFDAAPADATARAIIDAAATDLATMVRTLGDRLHLTTGAYPLALAGGVLVHQDLLRAAVSTRLSAWGLPPSVTRVIANPVAGAVALARRACLPI
jgi:N-acetylglucosamine kinase-like BadF-type ATPase